MAVSREVGGGALLASLPDPSGASSQGLLSGTPWRVAVGYVTCPRVLPSVAVHLAADRAASPLLATLAAPWGARKSPLCLALGLLAPQPMTLIHPFPVGT